MVSICADLRAEAAELAGLVGGLDDPDWDLQTPAEGWAVRDQIAHLAFYDEKALLALRDPDRFGRELNEALAAGIGGLEQEHLDKGRSLTGAGILDWWGRAGAELVQAYSQVDPRTRVVWYGPPMAARSKITARIMETWAHGQDVRDALGVAEVPTGRLRHVCHLSVRAMPWSFIANGMAVPDGPIRVELRAPDGEIWTWGDQSAADQVTGPAVDFALLATQRRHRHDLALTATGDGADQWLDIAQAFAGPPGPGRDPGQFT
jgi:uncharacterized protein (TIGR03084 family)